MKPIDFLKDNREKLFLSLGFFLVLAAGFFSGYFYSEEQAAKQEIKIEEPNKDCKDLFSAQSSKSESLKSEEVLNRELEAKNAEPVASGSESAKGMFVGSKNSNVYHRPDCASAKNIKEENRVWFSSAEGAEKKGYRPAKSCFK